MASDLEHIVLTGIHAMIIQPHIALITAALLLSSLCQAEELPKQVMQLLPVGYIIMTSASADFNGDGKTDYVVVLRSNSEDVLLKKGELASRRPLLVFLQGAANRFDIAARNDKVVYAADEGGQCDPFLDGEEGIAVKASYFTVQNSVACGQHWTDYFTFRYSPEQKRIVFHKRISEVWVMNPKSSANTDALALGSRKVVTANKSKLLSLGDYVPEP